jgi:putative tricarboxylic transport membrane protein
MTTGRSLRVGEAVLGFGVLALGLFIAIETSLMEVGASHAAVGPRLFPFLVAGGLILVAAALLREAFFGHVAHEGGFELDWLAVLLVSAGLIAQMVLLEWVGWIVAATILFVLTARAFMSRRLVADAALGVGLAALTSTSACRQAHWPSNTCCRKRKKRAPRALSRRAWKCSLKQAKGR